MQIGAGANLGRYQLLAEIGRGAMGIVFQALDPDIDRLVAIKVFSMVQASGSNDEAFRACFAREARAAGRLIHPGIVAVYDVGADAAARIPYIVMEYVPGQPLSRLLASTATRMEERYALHLAKDVAEALAYAHEKRVIHRDVKPANILITEDGNPKIADFGVARIDISSPTTNGESFGTPAYMAPEQLTGAPGDGRSDLFSLGVILYTMLIGFRPFQGNSAKTIGFKVINQEPVPVTSFHLDLSKDTEYVVARAMAKHPTSRYQTGWEFATDLGDILEGREPRSRRKNNVPVSAEVYRVTDGYRTLAAIRRPPTASPNEASASESIAAVTPASAKPVTVTPVPKPSATSGFAWKWNALPVRRLAPLFLTGVALAGVSGSVLIVRAERNFLRAADRQLGMPASLHENLPRPGEMQRSWLTVLPAAGPKAAVLSPVTRSVRPMAHPAILLVVLHHHLKGGELSVWVDGKLAYAGAVYGESKKHLLVLHEVNATEPHELHLSEGEHDLRVRVWSSAAHYDYSQSVHASLPGSRKAVLEVNCSKDGIELKLANVS